MINAVWVITPNLRDWFQRQESSCSSELESSSFLFLALVLLPEKGESFWHNKNEFDQIHRVIMLNLHLKLHDVLLTGSKMGKC